MIEGSKETIKHEDKVKKKKLKVKNELSNMEGSIVKKQKKMDVTTKEVKKKTKKRKSGNELSEINSKEVTWVDNEGSSFKSKKKNEAEEPPKSILKMKIQNDSVSQDLEKSEQKDLPLVNPCFVPKLNEEDATTKKDKMRAKKVRKREAKASAQEARKNAEGQRIRVVEAKQYLCEWNNDKSSWKFNKARQTWLLQNMFNTEAVDDESFAILLDYLRPLKGQARSETIKQSEAKVNETDAEFLVMERARMIVQALT